MFRAIRGGCALPRERSPARVGLDDRISRERDRALQVKGAGKR
jgi:hypothetical protein